MANIIKIKRRSAGGSAGAPSSLKTGEPAYNEQDNILYYGYGDDGSGNATSIPAIGGKGAFVDVSTNQTVGGTKTFSSVPASSQDASGSTDLVRKSQHDLKANLASPTFTGTPAAPTAANSTNTTQLATTAFVKNQQYLTGNETITISGDATGSGTTGITLTLVNTAVVAGTYTKMTVDSKGRITANSTLLAADIPTLTASKISDFDTQVHTSRLDQMASSTANVSFGGNHVLNVATPVNASDAATKAYVDSTASGLDFKASVRAATTANITLSGTQTVDGVSLSVGNRVLVKNQSTGSQNGLYLVASGAWTRATDFDSSAGVTTGALTFVEEGTANGGEQWILTTTGTITIGSTSLTFTQFGGGITYSAGDGLSLSSATFSVQTVSSGRITVGGSGIDLASGIVTPSTYKSVTVDTYGRVTAGTNPTTLTGYGITDAQPLDATLTAIAAATTAANKLIYFSGVDTVTVMDFTAAGRALLDDADAAAQRTTLGLGTIATQNANNVNITGGSIDGITIDGGTF